MELRRKFLDTLNNKDEPLAKRLKIADNALHCQEFPLHHREAVLIKWIGKTLKSNSVEVWNTFYKWLTSTHITDISVIDFSLEDLKSLMKAMLTRYKTFETLNGDVQNLIIKSSFSILQNKVFRSHFKYDLVNYCIFISNVLDNIESDRFSVFVNNEALFHKSVISDESFTITFVDNCFKCLSETVDKLDSCGTSFEDATRLMERCLFRQRESRVTASFKSYYKNVFNNENVPSDKVLIAKYIFDFLTKNYRQNFESLTQTYKLLFSAYIKTHKNPPESVYKFFILLIHTVGFQVKQKFNLTIEDVVLEQADIEKSLQILTGLFSVLSVNAVDLKCKVNDITFNDFITCLVNSALSSMQLPNKNFILLIDYTIKINPLILEMIVDNMLSSIILYENPEDVQDIYAKLLINIFDVYARLNRIPNLLFKLLVSLKQALDGETKSIENALEFIGEIPVRSNDIKKNINDIFPSAVLECFTEHVKLLDSWQVTNLWRTLIHKLDEAITKDMQISNGVECLDENTILYIQIIGVLLGQLMASARMAEHTVSEINLKKFIIGMKFLSNVMTKFGCALLKMEHNQNLMHSLLNLCFLWGELVMTLTYYQPDIIRDEFERKVDNNYSACNITYLHCYLTSEQWSLIMQRITNFGEKPCKEVMQKLCVQKLKAMVLFEESVPDEIITSIIQIIALHFEDTWDTFIRDPFCINNILPKLEQTQVKYLGETYLKHVNNDLKSFNSDSVNDSTTFSLVLLYKCISKIKKLFKSQKSMMNGSSTINSFTLINEIGSISFTDFMTENLKNIICELPNIFSSVISEDLSCNINLHKLTNYLKIITLLPIAFIKNEARVLLFWFFMALRINLKFAADSNEIADTCEDVIIGILKGQTNLDLCGLELHNLIEIIEKFTNKSTEIYSLVLLKVISLENNVPKLKTGVEYICDNLQNTNIFTLAVTSVKVIDKRKDINSFSNENKTTVQQLCKKLRKKLMHFIIAQEKDFCNSWTVEAYTILLKNYLVDDTKSYLPKLVGVLGKVITLANKNLSNGIHVKSSLLFFITILNNENKLNDIPKDFVQTTWKICSQPKTCIINEKEYLILSTALFMKMSNDQFLIAVEQLHRNTLSSITLEEEDSIEAYIAIWRNIFSYNVNPKKTKGLMRNIEKLLQKLITYVEVHPNTKIRLPFANFVVSLLQTPHTVLSPIVIDICICMVSTILKIGDAEYYTQTFNICISILDVLIKRKNPLVMDRLPAFLQQYRRLLKSLCYKNTNDHRLPAELKELADCAHLMEKLTKQLVACNKYMQRLAQYLIADILKQYEKYTFYPNVRMHLDNCIYNLLTLCDEHSIAYLMRVLSVASTEMFKVTYENYKKYYRFTGKI